ncbi:MAG: radical SAM protein [Planctomycetota bacterium]
MKKLIVAEPVSAGLMLSYRCSSGCRHCMYGCEPNWAADWISEEDIRCFLSQLAGRLKASPYGADSVDLSSGLHFSGGEPFLNFDLLLKAVQIADELDIPSTFVETNCYWCDRDDRAEEKLWQLKKAGLKGMMVSANPFILEHVPFERTERALKIGRKVFGSSAIVYQQFFYRQFAELGFRGTLSFEDYVEKAGLESLRYAELLPMGRLVYTLGDLFGKRPAEVFFGQSCAARLASPHHVHIDNYGNYMTGFCGGISLGDAHDLDAILAGVDLENRPVLKALVTDIEQLYNLGKDFGYEDLPDGYACPCHLCMDIRKQLVRQSDEFEELRPLNLYCHI